MAANTKSLGLEASSNQYASHADNAAFSTTGSMSIAGWVNYESTPSGNIMALVGKNNSQTNNRGYIFGLNDNAGTKTLQLRLSSDGSSGSTEEVSWTPSTSTWYHIAAVYNASAQTVDFYVNGSPQGSQQTGAVSSQFDNNAGFSIGLAGTDSGGSLFGYMDGLVDEVVVTSDVLTSGEVALLYGGRVASTILDNLMGYWQLNDAYTDLSGNSHTLTASGSPVFSATVPFANYTGDYTQDLQETITVSDALAKSITRVLSEVITPVDALTTIKGLQYFANLDEITTIVGRNRMYKNGYRDGIWTKITKAVGSWTKQERTTDVWEVVDKPVGIS